MSLNAQGQENKREPALEDTDKITFGEHNGEYLQDVPCFYLAWLWNEAGYKEYSGKNTVTGANNVNRKIALANYIWNSRNAINQELGEVKIS